MQETQVPSLVQEDPTCREAAKPVHHNYGACALEPGKQDYSAHVPQLLRPTHSRAHVLQQERSSSSLQLEKSLRSIKDPE